MARSMKEIEQDYANTAAAVGANNLRLQSLEESIEALRQEMQKGINKMKGLGKEAQQAQKKEELAKLEQDTPVAEDANESEVK